MRIVDSGTDANLLECKLGNSFSSFYTRQFSQDRQRQGGNRPQESNRPAEQEIPRLRSE
jgi:hypothetical protein